MDDEILAKIREHIQERMPQALRLKDEEDNDVLRLYLQLCIIQRLDAIDQSLGSIYSELNEIESAINRN